MASVMIRDDPVPTVPPNSSSECDMDRKCRCFPPTIERDAKRRASRGLKLNSLFVLLLMFFSRSSPAPTILFFSIRSGEVDDAGSEVEVGALTVGGLVEDLKDGRISGSGFVQVVVFVFVFVFVVVVLLDPS